jgi:hypothetical protein
MHNWIGLIVLVGIVGAMGLFLWRSIKLKSGGDGAPDSNFSSNWSGSDHHSGTDGHSGTQ